MYNSEKCVIDRFNEQTKRLNKSTFVLLALVLLIGVAIMLLGAPRIAIPPSVPAPVRHIMPSQA